MLELTQRQPISLRGHNTLRHASHKNYGTEAFIVGTHNTLAKLQAAPPITLRNSKRLASRCDWIHANNISNTQLTSHNDLSYALFATDKKLCSFYAKPIRVQCTIIITVEAYKVYGTRRSGIIRSIQWNPSFLIFDRLAWYTVFLCPTVLPICFTRIGRGYCEISCIHHPRAHLAQVI